MFTFAMQFIQFISVLVAVILIPVFIGLIVGAMREHKELVPVQVRSSNPDKKKGDRNV